MVSSEASIDLRLPVDTESKPVPIKKEHFSDLAKVQDCAEQLNQFRREIGRVFQLLSNMKDKANAVERDLTEKRRALISKYSIDGGRWAIDFAEKTLVKLDKDAPLTP